VEAVTLIIAVVALVLAVIAFVRTGGDLRRQFEMLSSKTETARDKPMPWTGSSNSSGARGSRRKPEEAPAGLRHRMN
jgi:hypothetical protein